MLEYHLKILRTNKVTVERHDGRRARYYAIYISPEDGRLLRYVSNNVASQMVILSLNMISTFNEILEHIKKAPSSHRVLASQETF